MAITETNVRQTQAFRKTKLVDLPVPTFKSSPKVRPNPYTGLPQTDAYAREHHLVEEAPETVLDATKSNNPF